MGLRWLRTGMSLLSLVITIAVVGLIVWAVVTYIPMPPTFRKVIIAVAAIAVLLFVLQAFGLLARIDTVRVPQVR